MTDIFRFDGKTVVIIGAGSGIGRAVAIGAAQQGAHVGCADINADSARATAEAITRAGGTADHAALDITDAAATDRVLDGFAAAAGRLDGLACTPSINVRKRLLDYREDEFDRVVRLNLKGSFNVVRSAGRIMTTQGGGSLVIFSSIRSLVVEPGQAIYSMTKAGILQLVRGAACEFGSSGVRVNAIGPGVIETPLTAPIKARAEWYQAYADKNILKRWARLTRWWGRRCFCSRMPRVT
jgi:NAD(P)-dependent dehydrogenase (short-subunit alcohol dehydrogenase family)